MNIKDGKTKKEILINQAMAIPKVSMRGGFSDRNGKKPKNVEIQLKDFDRRTRVQLHNLINSIYYTVFDKNDNFYDLKTANFMNRDSQDFIMYILGNVYSDIVDIRLYYDYDKLMQKLIVPTILHGGYDDVLTLIEIMIQRWDEYLKEKKGEQYYNNYLEKYNEQSLYEVVNSCFEREYVGYRFVGRIIVPIIDKYEISAINDALNTEYESVYEHISKANKFLADRKNPDYENSIKESISAVEAICKIITEANGGNATLGNMLNKLEAKGVVIHKAQIAAFKSLYGYTSDANGIRHAGDIGGPSSTFEDAKFMLVTCCAFINYLKSFYSSSVKR